MKALAEQISDIDGVNIYGLVVGVRGLMVDVFGSHDSAPGEHPHDHEHEHEAAPSAP